MKPGDLVRFRAPKGAFEGTWAEQLLPNDTIDDAWIPPDSPPGIYLGQVEVGCGVTDAEILMSGQFYVVRNCFIEPVQCKPPMGMV